MVRFEIYRDKAGEYRSRIRSSNGKIRFDSGEGYKRKASARKSITHLIDDCKAGKVVIADMVFEVWEK